LANAGGLVGFCEPAFGLKAQALDKRSVSHASRYYGRGQRK